MINKFVKVKYLFTLNMGQSPDSESCNTLGNGIPFLQGKADFGHISPTPKTYCISPKKLRIQVIFSYPFGPLLVI